MKADSVIIDGKRQDACLYDLTNPVANKIADDAAVKQALKIGLTLEQIKTLRIK